MRAACALTMLAMLWSVSLAYLGTRWSQKRCSAASFCPLAAFLV